MFNIVLLVIVRTSGRCRPPLYIRHLADGDVADDQENEDYGDYYGFAQIF